MLKRFNPTSDDFEELYKREDPWGIDGSFTNIIRIKIINNYFKNQEFNQGIDIGCGEGFFTSKLNFIKHKTGIDISSLAIKRASKKYSEINFMVGNPLKEKLINRKYDFVSCFEVLYYPNSKEDREKSITNLLELGTKNAIYAYSVVTIGSGIHRDYFTKNSFKELLSKHYKILDIVPFTLHNEIFILKIIQRIIFNISKRLAANLFYMRTLNNTNKNIYQHLFILKRLY
tara:strand:- start:234 stop:923 length:690 start_codon:yes stop_codon:yes gene_type:complete